MRIVSLAPEATEILASLGHGSEITALPAESVATPEQLAAALQITQPTLIFTSESVAGGGVPRVDVRRAISRLRPRPGVYALEPHTLGDILSDIKTVGDATGHQHTARTLIEALRARIDAVSLRSARVLETTLPRRVACLASRQPLTAAGWWLAELVGLAGGLDVLAGLGRPPRIVTSADIEAARPELVVWAEDLALPGCQMGLAVGTSSIGLLERLSDLILQVPEGESRSEYRQGERIVRPQLTPANK
jgi:ABC-type Fe3+-hydroxamate transport system substrate-binding protein